jgi:hypothetical protein
VSNTEKLVTWGLLGFIAWELYKPAPVLGGSDITAINDNIPLWVKQLSRRKNPNVEFFRRTRGLWGAC